jgi:hypothetical protein
VPATLLQKGAATAFLAPDIVTAILNGRHPPHLTANWLMGDTRLPLDDDRRFLSLKTFASVRLLKPVHL